MIMTFLARFAIGRSLSGLASRLPWQIWAALGVVAALGIVAWQIDSRAYTRGFDEADAVWVARVAAEEKRQKDVNDQALADALAEVARLNEAKEVRDAHIERLDREALEADNAQRECLDANSVRRLNFAR